MLTLNLSKIHWIYQYMQASAHGKYAGYFVMQGTSNEHQDIMHER